MERNADLNRYRHLRAISTRHHSAALDYVARLAILERAKDLGLAAGRTLVVESEEAMTLLFDLAVHTAKPGRSRAIERYARAVAPSAGPDEARTLRAICAARFSVWQIERFHEAEGLVVTDVLRGGETWLMDQGLTASGEIGFRFASRLHWPAEFAITCGLLVPVDDALMNEVLQDSVAWLRHTRFDQLADDPRFAVAIYRAALDAGVMDNVEFLQAAAE